MATTVAELEAVVTADTTQFHHSMGQARDEFGRFTAASETASAGTATAFAGIAVIAAEVVKSIFDIAVSFDDASDRIRIATGATGEALSGLEDSFKNIFTSIPTSAEEASKAIAFLSARLHETGPALEDVAKTELELARITGSALAPQLEATTRLFKDWEISTVSQTTSLDFLFKVSQKTSIGVTELSQKLVQFGAPLRQMGFSFEEAAVLIGKFQAEGVELNKALPGLRIALSKMAKEGVHDAGAAFQFLIEKVQAAKSPLEATRIAMEVFGRKAGPDMAEAIRQGRFSIEELQKTLAGSSETIAKAAKDTEDFAEKWTILKNKASAALEPLGKVMFDALSAVVSSVNDQGDEIERRWNTLWEDLNGKTGQQLQKLLDLFDGAAFGEAAYNMGRRMANSVIAGFKSGAVTEGISILLHGGSVAAAFGTMAGSTPVTSAGPDPALDPFKGLAARNLALTEEMRKGGKAAAEAWGAGHKSGAGKIKQALDDSYGLVQDWLRSVGGQIDISKKVWDTLGATVQNNLREQARAYLEDQVSVQRWGAVLVSIMGKVGQEVVKLSNGHLLVRSATIDLISNIDDLAEHMDDIIIPISHVDAVAQKMGQTFLDLGPAAESVTQDLLKDFNDMGRQIPASFNSIIDAIIAKQGPLTDSLLQVGLKVKGMLADAFQVIGNLPGKLGDTLRKATSEFEHWVATINGILGILHRIFSAVPENIGEVFAKISGVFKKTTADVQSSSEDWSASLEKMSTGVNTQMSKAATGTEAGAGRMVAAFAQIAGATLAFIGAKGQGFVGGAMSGALGGIAAAGGIATALGVALSPLTLGLSAAGGALLGGIIGLFGGKSAEQKAAEARAAEQAKLSMQQTAQTVINAAIQGFDSAIAFFEKLEEFTAPRKAKFQQFFKAMTRLMDGFLELAKAWAASSLTQAKAAAEAIGPIAQALAALPDAFQAINGHTGVAKSAFDLFFADMDSLMTRFFARSEVWIDGISKRAQKVANRLAPAVQLMTNFGGAFTAITDVSKLAEPTDEMFNMFDRILGKIVDHITNLSLTFDKSVLKAMANFSDKAGSALGLWKDAIDTIKATVDIPMVTDADINNLTTGIEKFVVSMSAAMTRLESTDVVKVSAFANIILPIAAALKSWAETSAAVRGYTAIASDAWDAIVTDFTKAIQLMGVLIDQATQFESMATTLEAKLKSGAQHLADGVAAMTAGVLGTASALQSAFGHIQGGEAQGTVAASSYSATSTGATQINLSLTVNPNDPAAMSALQALLNLFGPGSGLDSVIAQHS